MMHKYFLHNRNMQKSSKPMQHLTLSLPKIKHLLKTVHNCKFNKCGSGAGQIL